MCILVEPVHFCETHNPIFLLNCGGEWCTGGNEVIQTNAQNNKPQIETLSENRIREVKKGWNNFSNQTFGMALQYSNRKEED